MLKREFDKAKFDVERGVALNHVRGRMLLDEIETLHRLAENVLNTFPYTSNNNAALRALAAHLYPWAFDAHGNARSPLSPQERHGDRNG